MKKIVGIIAALALAGAVFARPDITPAIVEYTGNASLEWIANLDNETTGMKNSAWTRWKIQMRTDDWGGESNSGDGLWGELVIRAGGGYTAETATGANPGALYGWNMPVLEVTTAKIHFIDGDTFFHVSILEPGLSLGGGDLVLATASPWKDAAVGVTLTGKQGFTMNFGIPLVDFNLQFADNGEKTSNAKEFGFVFDATLKGEGFDVDGLAVTAGAGYSTEKVAGKSQDAAIFFKATYKLEIDDAMYVRPTVSFGLQGEAKQLVAGVLYGWGAEGQEPNFAGFSNGVGSVPNKCSDGVSIALKSTLADKAPMGFLFGFYDNKLLADFGIKIAAQLDIADLANFGKAATDAFDFALVYGSGDTFGDWKVAANLGAKFKLEPSKFGMLYGVSVTNSAIIQNTDLYVKYSGEHAAEIGGADLKGSVTLGAKINF